MDVALCRQWLTEGPNLDTVRASKLYTHIIITTRLVLYIYLYSLIYGSLCSGSESKWKRNERSNYNCTCCLRNSHNWNKNPLSGYLKTEIKETFYLSKIWCLTIISLIHSSLRRGLFPVMHDSSPSYTKLVTFGPREVPHSLLGQHENLYMRARRHAGDFYWRARV